MRETIPYIGEWYWWVERTLNGVSQCTISYGDSKDLILVHTVKLNPMIKAHPQEEWSLVV